MEKQAEAEKGIHAYIDCLCKQKFFGTLSLSFQGGNVESASKREQLSKSDLINFTEPKPEAEKGKRVIVAPLPKNGGA